MPGLELLKAGKMRVMHESVNTADINIPDFIAVFSSSSLDGTLRKSIVKIGLTSPVIIYYSKGSYELICGRKRLSICKELKIDFVSASVLNDIDLSEKDRFDIAFFDNISVRKFNLIEISDIIKTLFEKFKLKKEVIESEYLNYLGIGSGKKEIEYVRSIADYPDKLKNYILDWQLPVNISGKFSLFDKKDLSIVFAIVKKLQLHGGKLKQFLDFTYEICRNNKIKVSEIFGDNDLEKIIESKKLTLSQMQAKALNYLSSKRNPVITEMENQFRKISGSLTGMKKAAFSPPANFEGEELTAKVMFKNLSDLDDFCDSVKNISNRAKIKSLLELL